MNKIEKGIADSYSYWKDKKGLQSVHVSSITEGGNFNTRFDCHHYIGKNEQKIIVNKTVDIDIKGNRASFDSVISEYSVPYVRRGEPLIFQIDFDTDAGKLLWIALILSPEINVEGEKSFCNKSLLPRFELTIPSRVADGIYRVIKDKASIMQTVLSYDLQDLIHLVFFLGKSPFSSPSKYMSFSEIFGALIGSDLNGWIFSNISGVKKYHSKSDNPRRAIKILFRKGVVYDIVKEQDGIFISNEADTLGHNEETSLEFLLNNPSTADRLKLKVAQKETTLEPIGDSKEDIVNKIKNTGSEEKNNYDLSEETKENKMSVIKTLVEQGNTQRQIAEMTKLSVSMVNHLWKDVESVEKKLDNG